MAQMARKEFGTSAAGTQKERRWLKLKAVLTFCFETHLGSIYGTICGHGLLEQLVCTSGRRRCSEEKCWEWMFLQILFTDQQIINRVHKKRK
ncbi:hypothetical protein CEXT_229141 [Caerostris extrusa]|uniref:Uncharacterized protein n=1 Tax=Caerostris extrusa TaxID=172846 RepID=A0AAV4MTY8_CAEEX|nr:hypothetical protein CEXT_229141 [Caerostris extrusa]